MITNDPTSLGKRILHGAGIWALCVLACLIAALTLSRAFALELRPTTLFVAAALLTILVLTLHRRAKRKSERDDT